MLDRQINLFKVDTNAFLTAEENEARRYLVRLKKVRNKIYKRLDSRNGNFQDKYNELIKKDVLNFLENAFIELTDKIKEEEPKWKEYILSSAAESVKYNNEHPNDKHIRTLSEQYISYKDKFTGERKVNLSNVIAMFESTLSRSFNIQVNELTYDIFILEIYYYDIAQDLILNGFNYNGKHYVYFSSSAGQIRTKKAVFVEEEKYNACKNKLMCGLTVEKINEQGGMNINKFLAYTALSNSATDLWEDVFGKPFDIDRCIVVDDFETMVDCVVDHINYQTYEITEGVKMQIPIPHTDGCGLISSDYCNKNFMIRLPFVKGLLGSFDYKKFIKENNCSSKVKDIWGKEYDIFDDDIQVIFTKSQLKMYKFYSSWDEYKTYFKMYNCEAGICNMEEDRISNAKINYQMLQTLYDATDKEITDMCAASNKNIQTISDNLKNALSFFGVYNDDYEHNKDWFQKSLKIYPELITDPASKNDLKDLKNSMINKYRGGKLEVIGKFTFVLPDLYAFCEWLFQGIEEPIGLVDDGEVFCRLYPNSKELDCLRSPHLYIEHAVRNNVYNKKYRNQFLKDWFNTDAIYTSTHDPISRILQFDVDGDRLLVLAQKQLINIAKRCMNGVNPLYYEMKKAHAEEVNPQNIYNGLKLAFTGGRIGGISNDITKIWNSGDEISDDAKKAIRWLCMETNFTIDYAKTLFKPTRPDDVNEIIKSFTHKKTPYFFKYAKGKNDDQVEQLNNNTVNKIVTEIKDNRNMMKNIRNLNKLSYKILLPNKSLVYDNTEINMCFDKWNKKYGNNISFDDDDTDKNNLPAVVSEVLKELHSIVDDDISILTSLVRFLYKSPSTRKKKLLWYIYGKELYENICNNITDTPFCWYCGKRTDEKLDSRCKCFECRQIEYKSTGKKLIQCCDCGKDVILEPKQRTCRCEECLRENQLRMQRASMSKKRKCEVAR